MSIKKMAPKATFFIGSENYVRIRVAGGLNWVFLGVLGGVVAGLLYLLARLLPKAPG